MGTWTMGTEDNGDVHYLSTMVQTQGDGSVVLTYPENQY